LSHQHRKMSAPRVPDYESPASGPDYYITHTPPVIHENTRIVTASNVGLGHPEEDGWFLPDFYAFNYLLKGLGSSQPWLAAAVRRPTEFPWPPHHSLRTCQETISKSGNTSLTPLKHYNYSNR
jgi:hypothetical protein